MKGLSALLTIAAVILTVWAVVRVIGNEVVRNDQPAACSLYGGKWTVWDGWQCNPDPSGSPAQYSTPQNPVTAWLKNAF